MTCETCDGRGWVPRDGSQHGDACPDCFDSAGAPTGRKTYNGTGTRWYTGKRIGGKNTPQPGGFHHRKGHHS